VARGGSLGVGSCTAGVARAPPTFVEEPRPAGAEWEVVGRARPTAPGCGELASGTVVGGCEVVLVGAALLGVSVGASVPFRVGGDVVVARRESAPTAAVGRRGVGEGRVLHASASATPSTSSSQMSGSRRERGRARSADGSSPGERRVTRRRARLVASCTSPPRHGPGRSPLLLDARQRPGHRDDSAPPGYRSPYRASLPGSRGGRGEQRRSRRGFMDRRPPVPGTGRRAEERPGDRKRM
jgi:hypothetical protein